MKKFYTLCISAFLLLFMSCNFNTKVPETEKDAAATETKTVEINGEYSLDVPDHMKEAKNLNDVASLQYHNVYKQMYVVVIDEPKEDFRTTFEDLSEYDTALSVAQNYRDVQMKLLSENMGNIEKSESESMYINGLDAEMLTMDAQVEGIDISYLLTFIEGDKNVYLIMAWTQKSKKEKYIETFREMVKSFKLVEKPVVN